MNFHCDLYYRNTWTQITINPQIQTYGQLQALILNYLHLSLNRFEAIMVDYQVIGLAGRLLDQPIVEVPARNLQLQVIVNYFPMNLSQPASIFREWLHLQSRQVTDLVLHNLYLSLLITNPMANLIQTHDIRLNGTPIPAPAPATMQATMQATVPVDQWQSHNLLNPSDQHSPTMTDWTYYQYYYPTTHNPVQTPQFSASPEVQPSPQAQSPQFQPPIQLNTANLDVVDEADIYSSENSESDSEYVDESESSESESSEDSTPDTQTFEFQQLSSNPNVSGFMSITDMISGSTNNAPGRRRSNRRFNRSNLTSLIDYFLSGPLNSNESWLDEPHRVTLTQEQIAQFETNVFGQLDASGRILAGASRTCSICLQEYRPDETIRIMGCNHFFHQNCIDQMLSQYSVKCPICRQDARQYLAESHASHDSHANHETSARNNITFNPRSNRSPTGLSEGQTSSSRGTGSHRRDSTRDSTDGRGSTEDP